VYSGAGRQVNGQQACLSDASTALCRSCHLTISLRLLPYVVPLINNWKRRMLRERDLIDSMF